LEDNSPVSVCRLIEITSLPQHDLLTKHGKPISITLQLNRLEAMENKNG